MQTEYITKATAKLAEEIKIDLNSLRIKGEGEVISQSSLQKLLREKFFINIIIFNDDGDIKYKNLRFNFEIRPITKTFKKKDYPLKSIVGTYTFKTYEEALEQALQDTLNLLLLKK